MLNLPYSPSQREIAENSDCKKCRQDWGKQGPICHHCKLEGVVLAYQQCVFAYRKHSRKSTQQSLTRGECDENEDEDEERQDLQYNGGSFEVEGVAIRLTKLLHRFLHKYARQVAQSLPSYTQSYGLPCSSHSVTGEIDGCSVDDTTLPMDLNSLLLASDKCLAYLEALQREILPLKSLWRQHLHCFSVLDELQSAKMPMQLLRLDTVTAHQTNMIKQKQNTTTEKESGLENLQGDITNNLSPAIYQQAMI